MNKKRIKKLLIISTISGLIIAIGTVFYLFNMPHRNVQKQKADYNLTSTEIVNEYLTNFDAANAKYLATDGNSKILKITGTISAIKEDFSGQKVLVLKENFDNAGVNVTLNQEVKNNIPQLIEGNKITIKGVIRSGASYDEDLELYENVVIDKASIIN